MLEISFQIPRNSKFPVGACPRTPLEISCAFGTRLHAPVSKILDPPLLPVVYSKETSEKNNYTATGVKFYLKVSIYHSTPVLMSLSRDKDTKAGVERSDKDLVSQQD